MAQIAIKEFAAERGTSYNAITQFLYRRKRNNEKNGVKSEELTIQNGVKVIDTNSDLYKTLDKKYPLPSNSIEISKDEELIDLYKQLNEANEQLIAEQEKCQKLIAQAAQLQIIKQQLQNSREEKDKAIADRDAYREESLKAKVQADEANKRAESAEQKVERMKNASLWQRIRKKW